MSGHPGVVGVVDVNHSEYKDHKWQNRSTFPTRAGILTNYAREQSSSRGTSLSWISRGPLQLRYNSSQGIKNPATRRALSRWSTVPNKKCQTGQNVNDSYTSHVSSIAIRRHHSLGDVGCFPDTRSKYVWPKDKQNSCQYKKRSSKIH